MGEADGPEGEKAAKVTQGVWSDRAACRGYWHRAVSQEGGGPQTTTPSAQASVPSRRLGSHPSHSRSFCFCLANTRRVWISRITLTGGLWRSPPREQKVRAAGGFPEGPRQTGSLPPTPAGKPP